ncbi:hypothetical protein D3C73_731520 [compost metagenome]
MLQVQIVIPFLMPHNVASVEIQTQEIKRLCNQLHIASLNYGLGAFAFEPRCHSFRILACKDRQHEPGIDGKSAVSRVHILLLA